ncbi:probable protein CCN1-putative cell cycle control protein [Serendipita indica DSM 11827]|uniref:Pre-mRNA-splicing factor CLF1 n=1 Tax=Serendipita indica (strain DSM 11827) TaxID=1109443 RepID=G4T7Z4_SERID|nr:probable protein CCN1-putative cell cycle control protein [Serendipita indica DSM 11827]
MQDGRTAKVKNRAPAAVQITAEQLLRDAQERQEAQFRAPRQRVEDFEELDEYRGRKRKEFEERIRRTPGNLKEWTSYASWEASQGQYDRSRSVYERALEVDPRASKLWLSYTEMELKARNVQHARNLFDRAVTLLPRVDLFWYKYVYLEELLENIPGARQVFERWMAWEPEDKAWAAYIKLEERYQELERASEIYKRWVAVRPEPRIWVKWAKFEEDRGMVDRARDVFDTALRFFGDDETEIDKAQAVFAAFAKMETRLKEYERARVIYKFALSRLPRSKSASLYAAYTKFEKQHGTRTTVEATVWSKRRIQYEDEVVADPFNYDTWFDFARLEEDAYRALRDDGESEEELEKAIGRVREVYERAVATVPLANEKRMWRRYIFLWLYYAVFEEIETKDYSRARDIYKAAISVVPHKQFTFAKLWLQYARFEIRRLDLVTARKVLGTSIGMCPKEKLFKGYIDLELELKEFDRARTLYEKYIAHDPTNAGAWIAFASLENALQDIARARAVYELGVGQPTLAMPELLWKSYIDFEVVEGGYERDRTRVRKLYERLVERTGHVKVWISWAIFEGTKLVPPVEEGEEEEEEGLPADLTKAREVFERGYKALKDKGLKEERVVLLEGWKKFEEEHGTPEDVERVEARMPQVTKRWRKLDSGDMEEYWDILFADDEREANPATFKFLQNALAWKTKQGGGDTKTSLLAELLAEESSEEEEEEDDEKSSKEGDQMRD